ncbi:MAG: cation diffusion facilitator family transporter [Candidatus Aminicenantes bacterium]|nr:cation diffusion facilitator family transporter [Candidatus Aminicenantes bacterium]
MAQKEIPTNSIAKPFSGDDEAKQIYRVAGYAFLLNLFLAVMKAVLAFFSGSLVITASAIDSGTDAVASLVIYGGVKLSIKKTRSFPMGLYKLENVASLLIALFIFIAGYEIIRKILSPVGSIPRISLSYIVLLFAGTVGILLFGQYAISIGRRTGSPTLIAEGRHRQVDVLSSIVVLISVVLSYFGLHLKILGVSIDQIGAALILIFIAHAGWGLFSDGMRVLLDASIDFSTLDSIREIIQSEPMVSEIKSLMGRNAGRFRFIQATITLKTENLERAHRISEDIERKIRNQVTHVEKVIIHYGPSERTHDRIALPLEDGKDRISRHFGEAPYFGIVRIRRKDKEIEKQEILENPHRSVEIAKGIRVAEWLVGQGVDHVGMKEDVSRKGPGYVLSNGGVKTHIISAERIDQAISEIIADF